MRGLSRIFSLELLCAAGVSVGLVVAGCGDDSRPTTPGDGGMNGDSTINDSSPDGDSGQVQGGLLGDAPVTISPLYMAVDAMSQAGEVRPWHPVDLDEGTDGALWVIQRMNRLPEFIDAEECTMRSQTPGVPNDCFGLSGSTVTITNPAEAGMATSANQRARLVVDGNSWHFMRRPAGIAFGLAEVTLPVGDPGTIDRNGTSLVSGPQTYTHIFATCHEHETGNFTDQPPFIGPSLWTGDMAIYDNGVMPFPWSNGSHLDMVHATQHCMGIAWERDNVYWLINGAAGTLDRYDFGMPHLPGHFYHEDAEIKRWLWDADQIARVQDIPSNLEISANELYIADTGNARILAVDIANEPAELGGFRSFENLPGTIHRNPTTRTVADTSTLTALWGGTPQPSGLAVFSENAILIGDYATGNISAINPTTGEEIRTIDTGLGAGLAGVTVMQGVVYFAHMQQRGVYRIDVME